MTSETETLRAAIEAALRRRDPEASVSVLPERQGKYGNADPLALAMVNGGDVTMVRATEADALRALAIACGMRDNGSDPAEEVERLTRELAEARAALRYYAPCCVGCGDSLATRTVGYDDVAPSTLRRVCDREVCGRGLPVSGDTAHAHALRAAEASQ